MIRSDASSWKLFSAKSVTDRMIAVRIECAVGAELRAAAISRVSPNSSPAGLKASVTPSVESRMISPALRAIVWSAKVAAGSTPRTWPASRQFDDVRAAQEQRWIVPCQLIGQRHFVPVENAINKSHKTSSGTGTECLVQPVAETRGTWLVQTEGAEGRLQVGRNEGCGHALSRHVSKTKGDASV